MSRPPITVEHHPGPLGRRWARRLFDLAEALLGFLLAPQADLSITPKDKP